MSPHLRVVTLLFALCPAAAAPAQDPEPPARPPDPVIPADQEVVTTQSGLKYSVLTPGEAGGRTPRKGDPLKVHYSGWLSDGTLFASSVQSGEPLDTQIGGVIEGWNEALAMMTKGARWKLTIPPALGYRAQGKAPSIPPNATLIFEVELLEIRFLPDFHAAVPENQKTTPSGLKYEVLTPGKGEPVKDDRLMVLEYGLWTVTGEPLDSSARNGRPVEIKLSQVGMMDDLPFLAEALGLLTPGARLRFEVPPELCFKDQERPGLPANSTCVWEWELVRVIDPLPLPEFAVSADDASTRTESGLRYEVLQAGTGAKPGPKGPVTVNYAAWLVTGKLWDASFERGEPAVLQVEKVIKGLQEGLQLMQAGSIYRFTIPADLAYGANGAPPVIGPNATVIFYVHLVKLGR